MRLEYTYEYQIGSGDSLKKVKSELQSSTPFSLGELIGLASKYASDNNISKDDVSIAAYKNNKLREDLSYKSKNMEQNKESLKEDVHLLQTPTFVGTADERLEALNLWTSILGNLKKVTDLPSPENKINILSYLISESNSTINRLSNGSIKLTPVQISPEISNSNLVVQNNESLISNENKEKLFGSNDRMKELAGLSTREVK